MQEMGCLNEAQFLNKGAVVLYKLVGRFMFRLTRKVVSKLQAFRELIGFSVSMRQKQRNLSVYFLRISLFDRTTKS